MVVREDVEPLYPALAAVSVKIAEIRIACLLLVVLAMTGLFNVRPQRLAGREVHQ